MSQLQRGTKLWLFESREKESWHLTRANKEEMREVARSLPSTLLDDWKHHQIHFCVQEAGVVIFFPAKTCYCVLSGPGPTSLLTVTFDGSLEVTELSWRKLYISCFASLRCPFSRQLFFICPTAFYSNFSNRSSQVLQHYRHFPLPILEINFLQPHF